MGAIRSDCLGFLDLFCKDVNSGSSKSLRRRFHADKTEEGQTVGLLGALAATENHEGNLDLLSLAALFRDRRFEPRAGFSNLFGRSLSKLIVV